MSTLSTTNKPTTNEPAKNTEQPTKAASFMVIIDALVAPSAVFNKLTAAKNFSWLALALLLVVSSASSWVFFDNMSTAWLVEQQLLQAGEMSPSELIAAKDIMQQTAEYTGLISVVFSSLSFIVIGAIFAGYYLLAARLTSGKSLANTTAVNDAKLTFSDWFSFNIWTQMPLLINSLGFSLLIFTAATTDLPLSLINYASLNQLFLSLTPEHHLFMLAESANLFYLWSIFIATLGLQQCCKLSLGKAAFIAQLPYLLIFGLWFVFA